MNQVEAGRQMRYALKLFAQSQADEIAVNMPSLFDAWNSEQSYAIDSRVRYNDKLYKCRQAHTSQSDWTPVATPALWEVIDVAHAGTRDDPIPAAENMEYFSGKYYIEDGTLYLCDRDTGQSVAYLPSQLIGHYFTLA